MLTALGFMSIMLLCYFMALIKSPIWGLFAYANVYFHTPSVEMNWWAQYIPDIRWSLLSAAVLIASMVIHRKKLGKHKYRHAYWVLVFYVLTLFITNNIAVDPFEAERQTGMLLTYCIIIYILIRSLADFNQLRLFVLMVICLAANLGLSAIFEGKLIKGRLENIGPADAFSSNEFAVMVAAILPFLMAFLLKGKKYERVLCFLSLPFLLNAFILCASRGAFVALSLGSAYGFFFVANKKLKKYLMVLGVFVFILSFALTGAHFRSRIATLWETDINSEATMNELSSGRLDVWKYGLNMSGDYPFGTGPGGFRALSRFYMPKSDLTFHPGAIYGVRAAHNSFLLVLVEQGYVGFIIYSIICFGTLYSLYKSSKKLRKFDMTGSFIDLFIVGFNMSFAVTLMGGMFGSQVYYEFFWWQVALSIVIYSLVVNMERCYMSNLKLNTKAA